MSDDFNKSNNPFESGSGNWQGMTPPESPEGEDSAKVSADAPVGSAFPEHLPDHSLGGSSSASGYSAPTPEGGYSYGTFTSGNAQNVNVNISGQTEEKKGADGFAITSMILGIISLVCGCSCCCCVGWFLGWGSLILTTIVAIIGLVLGIISVRKQKNGMAISGIIMCSIAIVFMIIGILLIAAFSAEFLKEFYDEFYEEFSGGGNNPGELISRIFKRK